MKIQKELIPMTIHPSDENSLCGDFGISIYIYNEHRLKAYKYFDINTVIYDCSKRFSWDFFKNCSGWCFSDPFSEIEEEKPEEPEPEQLTIADLIKKAKEGKFKYIAQDKNGRIFSYTHKPIINQNFWLEDPVINFIPLHIENVKKWYEGDWKNSLIEVK